MRGVNLSKEVRTAIWTRFVIDGHSPIEVFNIYFRGDTRMISLKRLYDLHNMFTNNEHETNLYLACCRHRGTPPVDNFSIIDGLMTELVARYPNATLEFYLLKLAEIRGHVQWNINQVRDSFRRNKISLKMNSFFSARQDPVRIEEFMLRMRNVFTDGIVNWDQCSCSIEKFRPRSGRGNGRVVVNEWVIGNNYYSAMAAVCSRGVLYFVIVEGTISHVEVELFLRNLQPFLLPGSFGLFDNASIQVMQNTLELVDDIFVGMWGRLPEYCPQLAPIEKVFSLVWGYVRRRWLEASQHPLRILCEAFQHYSVGGPGASSIRPLFNVYLRN